MLGRNPMVLILALCITSLLKVIPHLSAISPLLSVALFSGCVLSRMQASALILTANFIADALLAYVYGYPLVGSWSLFVYSGLLLLPLLGERLKCKPSWLSAFGLTSLGVLGFWVWTNLGVWLFADLYVHDLSGLWQCYAMALPFLARSWCANALGAAVLFYCAKLKSIGHCSPVAS